MTARTDAVADHIRGLLVRAVRAVPFGVCVSLVLTACGPGTHAAVDTISSRPVTASCEKAIKAVAEVKADPVPRDMFPTIPKCESSEDWGAAAARHPEVLDGEHPYAALLVICGLDSVSDFEQGDGCNGALELCDSDTFTPEELPYDCRQRATEQAVGQGDARACEEWDAVIEGIGNSPPSLTVLGNYADRMERASTDASEDVKDAVGIFRSAVALDDGEMLFAAVSAMGRACEGA